MKIFKILFVALVAMCGFASCNDCDHDFIEVDYSKDIVGTWTVLEPEHSAAYIFNADGTLSTTGFDGEEYWEDVKGTYSVVNNKITIKFETGRNINGSFDIIPGQSISIVGEKGRHTYNYCKEDLSDEIVGMWVSNNGPTDMENEIQIRTYDKDGIVTTTGVRTIDGNAEWMLNEESKYRVVGDLIFKTRSKEVDGQLKVSHSAERFVYAPKGTALGDIMNVFFYLPMGDNYVESVVSFLRIKQHLELPGMKYDYIKTFVSNVKGIDKDIDVMGYKFNFAKMDGVMLDKMLKTLLFTVEFPDANSIKYSCLYDRNAEPAVVEAPIAVDGNKMTIKISEEYPGLKDVDMYTFQDKDNTQMHMYMPTYSFINFFGNMQVIMMSQLGMIDTTDAAAVKAVFDSIDDAVETINVSFVMTKSTKAI